MTGRIWAIKRKYGVSGFLGFCGSPNFSSTDFLSPAFCWYNDEVFLKIKVILHIYITCMKHSTPVKHIRWRNILRNSFSKGLDYHPHNKDFYKQFLLVCILTACCFLSVILGLQSAIQVNDINFRLYNSLSGSKPKITILK